MYRRQACFGRGSSSTIAGMYNIEMIGIYLLCRYKLYRLNLLYIRTPAARLCGYVVWVYPVNPCYHIPPKSIVYRCQINRNLFITRVARIFATRRRPNRIRSVRCYRNSCWSVTNK